MKQRDVEVPSAPLQILDSSSASRRCSSPPKRTIFLVLVLLATNVATLGLLLWKVTDRKAPNQVFAGAHSDVEPVAYVLAPEISTPRMQRHFLSYAGTARANSTVAAGRTSVHDVAGNKLYEVHMELVNNSYFGQYANTNGVIGNRRVHFRVIRVPTGESVVLVPMGFSTAATERLTLVPSLYHFSYRQSPDVAPTSSFVSTVTGSAVFADTSDGGAQAAWEVFMPDFFSAYGSAAAADAPNATARRRRLSFETWAGGQVGGALGGAVGGSLGSSIGTVGGHVAGGENAKQAVETGALSGVGKMVGGTGGARVGAAVADVMHGDNTGQAAGSVAGWVAGAAAGTTVGGAIGGVAGGALGSAIGGPVGGVVGVEAGSWLGRKLGTYEGGTLGSTLGGEIGSDADHWAHNAYHDVDNWA